MNEEKEPCQVFDFVSIKEAIEEKKNVYLDLVS